MFDRANIDWPLEVELRSQFDADPADLKRLTVDLASDCTEFSAIVDDDSANVLIGGCEERQLERNLALLQSKLMGKMHAGPLQVGYRETVRRTAEADEMLKGDDGSDRFRVQLRVEPRQSGSGNEFNIEAASVDISSNYTAHIEDAIRGMLNEGILEGFAFIDVAVTLVIGEMNLAGAQNVAIEKLVRGTFNDAVLNARAVVMEPVVFVEVISPVEFIGGVIGDLNARRGALIKVEPFGADERVRANVPIAGMFGYANKLAAMTQDRASYSARTGHYQEGPPDDWIPPEGAAAALQA